MEHVLWECPAYSSNRSVFINSLSKNLCSDFHLMSAFEKTRYIFDQSIWECIGHFDHWFSNIKSFLGSVWNLRKEKLYPEDFSMNTASNSSGERRMVNGRNAMAKRPRVFIIISLPLSVHPQQYLHYFVLFHQLKCFLFGQLKTLL